MRIRQKGAGITKRKNILAAQAFGQKHLGNMHRRTGEDYAQHGWEVAATLQEVTDDPTLLRAAILHDLPLHPHGRALMKRSPLSADERRLIGRMHRLRRLHIDASTHDLDTVIEAFGTDARLLPLRMAHRLNDVRHLDRFTGPLRKQIARETLHMYAAIAGRLGLQAWRREMEDLCFPIVSPRAATTIDRLFDNAADLDEISLQHAKSFLSRALREAGIETVIDSRIKGRFATYRKMVVKRRAFHELTDRLALRIIVPDTDRCYQALGIVHRHFHPMPGKMKDYIGAPKENGYRSIHTVVYPLPGVSEQPLEIQIRTPAMHRECEYGLAAHANYKHLLYTLSTGSTRVNLLRNLQHLRDHSLSPKQFQRALRTYFREDHIAIFDAKGNLYHLRKPASAVDFACHVHGKRVHRWKAVRINGRTQPPFTLLHDGDTVDIRFGRQAADIRSLLHACHHPQSERVLKRER